MPLTVDNDRLNPTPEAMARLAARGLTPLVTLDPANPPTMPIPYQEFPRIVYKHPREAYRKVEHRNAMREIVQVEMVANEHIAKSVADQGELDQALAAGWVIKPYIPEQPPDPLAGLYDEKEEKSKRKSA